MPIYGSVDLSMAQAPSGSRGTSPTEGQLYYDTDDDNLYAYNGTVWAPIASAAFATGGSETTYSGYKVHTFLLADSGNDFVVTGGSLTCDILVVAGGGGGGYDWGGGGGAGGLIYDNDYAASGTITVTVGSGGASYTNGADSVFGSLTAIGGGRGGSRTGTRTGAAGGSGGGGCYNGGNGGAGTAGQGNAGGGSVCAAYQGGGGGGAGGEGSDADDCSNNGGDGGVGLQYAISGANTYYAGGGGGTSAGSGGTGGGGAGAGSSGTANTGGGGGGATGGTGGAGGSGIVVIRYAV